MKLVHFYIVLTFARCGMTSSTQALLDASFINYADIELVSPPQDVVSISNPELVWSQDVKGLNYRLEIARDVEFSDIVARVTTSAKRWRPQEADLIGISKFDAVEYYWRVAAENTTVISAVRRFQMVDSTIVYVNGSSTSALQVGNKSNPFKTITTGILTADTRRATATTPMQVRVSRDDPNGYTELIQMRGAISVLGGYDAKKDWGRSILNYDTTIRAPADIAVTFSTSITAAVAQTTVIEGFHIEARNPSSSFVTAVGSEQSYGIVRNNFIRAMAGTTAYGVNDGQGSLVITGNTIQTESDVFTSAAVYLNFSRGSVVTNNILFYAGGADKPAIYIFGAGTQQPIVTNNTIIAAARTGGTRCLEFSIQATQRARITNNIFMPWFGTTRHGIIESAPNSNPGTVENNLFLNSAAAGTFYTFGNNTPTTDYTDLTFQSPTTSFNSGPDKARANILPTAGTNTVPFASFPQAIDFTAAASSSSTRIVVASGAPYANGHIIEIYSDSIARKVSCAGACTTSITFDPPYYESTVPASRSVRIWGTNATAQECYNNTVRRGKACRMANYNLVQAAGATAQDWADLRYGGKRTSTSACGVAAGGVAAAGEGVESCGDVSSDLNGNARTAVVSQATSNGLAAAGFSVGAHEVD